MAELFCSQLLLDISHEWTVWDINVHVERWSSFESDGKLFRFITET